MANKIAIIHFQPLELYPPAMNDIIYLENALQQTSIDIYTTKTIRSLFSFNAGAKRSAIKRVANLSSKGIRLYINYFLFYFLTTIYLLVRRPAVVLYFETLSSFPAIFYKRFVNKNAAILVHYHEYTSPGEYQQGMKLDRWFHKLEKKSYPVYEWISHMIRERMDLFMIDNPGIRESQTQLLPNYPPLSWKRENQRPSGVTLKAVYVGSLSLETMYVREFAEWVNALKGKISWDIYSFNYEPEVLEYLQALKSPFIHFKNGLKYFDIPSVLQNYQVGVILYKGTVQNYVFNAPNKLFEYLSADLDVWLPDVMKGSLPYVRDNSFPKVLALNFNALQNLSPDVLFSRAGLPHIPSTYFCESVLGKLSNKIVALLDKPDVSQK